MVIIAQILPQSQTLTVMPFASAPNRSLYQMAQWSIEYLTCRYASNCSVAMLAHRPIEKQFTNSLMIAPTGFFQPLMRFRTSIAFRAHQRRPAIDWM